MSIELWAARLERPLTERETAAMLRLLPAGAAGAAAADQAAGKAAGASLRLSPPAPGPAGGLRLAGLPEIRLTSLGKPWFPEFRRSISTSATPEARCWRPCPTGRWGWISSASVR